MTKTRNDIEVSKRLRGLIEQRYPARGRFRVLEAASGVPEWKWKNFFYERQQAGADQVKFWLRTYPEDEAVLTPMPKDDFLRGFFAAVAKLIQMHGYGVEARELFELGGDPSQADDFDKEVFRSHGLMD